MSFRLARQGVIGGLHWEIFLFSAALFACCMFCHGELARRKPEPRQGLAFFYLMVATGGAVGAVFVGLVAPHIFSTYLELPIGIALCIILGVALLYGYSSPRHLARLMVVATLAFVLGTQFHSTGATLLRVRNFYGTLQVIESTTAEMAARALYNGTILHGIQFSTPERSRITTTYYGPQSGAGLVLQSRHSPPQRVGVFGLGVGTLAAYGRAGDYFRFYEINPAVIRIASEHFRFLKESEARTEVVAGDGRLSLERESKQNFDVLVLDAFSGDAIPVHLLTQQAFEIYFRHLRPGGIIAVHVTNKYLDLASVVESTAASLGKQALFIHSDADRQRATYAADWSLVAEDRGALRNFEALSNPRTAARRMQPWTDQYSNLFQILK
jgi:spermidine synthase